MKSFLADESKRPEKIKDSHAVVRLWNQELIQFHRPFEKITPLNLKSLIPEAYQKFPLEIEIGCGKGEFIAHRSNQMTDSFFIGIDRRMDRIKLTQNKISHPRCLIVHEDARRFLEAGLPQNIAALHVYHPDPWPKSKHHKHRFFRSPDALKWVSAVAPDGFVYISTDHRDYFEEILDITASWGPLLTPQAIYKKEFFHSKPKTHFESIFLRKKEPVFKAVFRRNFLTHESLTQVLGIYRNSTFTPS